MPVFSRYIGIDYSGAQTPTASLKALRVYLAEGDTPPVEVFPPPSPRKYWTRKGIANWLVERLSEGTSTLVGIDHGFSFPLRYFETHHLLPDWPTCPNSDSTERGEEARGPTNCDRLGHRHEPAIHRSVDQTPGHPPGA